MKEKMTLDELAEKLTAYSRDFDPYGFADSMELGQTFEDAVAVTKAELEQNGCAGFRDAIRGNLEGSEEMQEDGEALLKAMDEFEPETSRGTEAQNRLGCLTPERSYGEYQMDF